MNNVGTNERFLALAAAAGLRMELFCNDAYAWRDKAPLGHSDATASVSMVTGSLKPWRATVSVHGHHGQVVARSETPGMAIVAIVTRLVTDYDGAEAASVAAERAARAMASVP